jgi:hypothetical protein
LHALFRERLVLGAHRAAGLSAGQPVARREAPRPRTLIGFVLLILLATTLGIGGRFHGCLKRRTFELLSLRSGAR